MVFSCRTGSLWPSAGTAMRGMVREYTGGNSRGPGWRSLRGPSVKLGRRRRRQAGSGMARSRARARLNWVSQGQRWGRCRVRRREAGDSSGEGEEPPPEGLGGHHLLTQTGPRCPTGQVMRHHLYRQFGGETARRHVVQRRTSGLEWRSRPRHGGGGRPPVPGFPRPGR